MTGFSEDVVEQAGIEILKDLGWTHLPGLAIAPDGSAPQRGAFSIWYCSRGCSGRWKC